MSPTQQTLSTRANKKRARARASTGSCLTLRVQRSLFLLQRRAGRGGLLSQARKIEFDRAAAVFTGILGRLLIFNLVVDDGAQGRPVDGRGDTAPVDKQGRCGIHLDGVS